MKKILIGLSTLLALSLGACQSQSGHKAASGADSAVVRINVPVSDSLARQMKDFMQAYYTLKDAFVKSDTGLANVAAAELREASLGIHAEELKSDAARYRQTVSAIEGLGAEIAGLTGERTMLGKRQEFQMISGITYKLIKNTGMKDQTVYRDFCPMFNSGDGAFWLSDSPTISNPYYGTEMPDCGQLSETISF